MSYDLTYTPAANGGPALKSRRGLTIVEVLIAVMLLSVGVVALASSAAVVTRQMNDGNRRARAASLAEARFEKIAARRANTAAACNGIVGVGGSVTLDSTTRGIREQVVISRPLNDGTVTVVNTVTMPKAKAPLVFRSVIRCN